MCGIAGIISTQPIEDGLVSRMLEAIAYRGPDHRGTASYQSQNGMFLHVGQARLAIVDLSPEANQPFENDSRTTSLTFNGEFYNFQVLRESMARRGAHFRTTSDTEVALARLDDTGMDSLSDLWGMFAGAYYRSEEGRLWLFRDRHGKKPLYVYPHGKRIYFASEPKAILAVLDHRPEPDDDALSRFFYLGYIPTDACAWRGMFKIPAGAFMDIGPDLNYHIERWYKPESETVIGEGALESVFMDAVEKRMIADVPLAAFLSGGLDSSLVVAAMSRLSPQNAVNTFAVRFAGPQAMDESGFARLVAQHCRTNHQEVVLDVATLKAALPEVLAHFDEPFGDSSAVPMLLVSREARKHFTVALSGDAADEIFAGYRKYLGEHYLQKLGPYPLRRLLWRRLTGMLPTGRTNRLLEMNRRIRRLLAGDAPTARERHINWLHMSPLNGADLLGPRLREAGFSAVKTALLERLEAHAELNQILEFDQNLVLPDDMFVKVDRMSMKASLEVRSPFADHRLINLANRLPASRKLDGTRRKAVLLDVLGRLLPPEILDRPKTGFEMPLGAWLRDDLAQWTEKQLFETADTSPWVNQDALRDVWRTHHSGKLDCTEMIWYHIVFANWLKGYAG